MSAEEFQSNIQAVIETLLEKTKNLDQVPTVCDSYDVCEICVYVWVYVIIYSYATVMHKWRSEITINL